MKKIILSLLVSILLIGHVSAQITTLILTTSVTAATACITPCNGTATVNVTGGTPPYTYLWNIPLAPQQTQTATGLCPGTYQVGVFDASTPFPASGQSTVTITCATTGVSEEVNSNNEMFIFPNPVHNELFLHVNEPITGKIEITIASIMGSYLQNMQTEMNGTSTRIDISVLPPGFYSLEMKVNGELIRQKFVKQ
jgi:hypothetical protein